MNEKENAAMIPYYVHEGEMNRMERLNKRWFISFLVVLAILFVTNAGWIIYENQFETVTYDQQAHYDTPVDTSILNNGTGSVYYGSDYPAEGDGAGEEGIGQ